MALINYDLFASDSADNCELKNLTALLEQLDFSELINEILIRRKGRGRRDWPIEAMLNAVFAIDILQHRSVSGFVRELKRNPALMHVLGFPMRRGFHTDPAFGGYAVPSDSAFCRFIRLLTEIERGTGALMRVFEAQVDEIAALLPDFGKSVGYDGKAVESHSTGRPLKHKAIDKTTGRHPTSDPDASWGVHEQYGTDQNGREVRKTKKWFGYTLHTHGDVTYELPIRFRLETARESEYRHCEGLIEEHEKLWFFDRCRSFVADRGLDSNQIRKRLFKNDILPVIDTRRMWQDVNLHPQQLKVPTRPLDESKVDTILRTENGSLYCQCPQSRELRRMHYQGREQKRGTLKWACPAASYDFTCKGQVRNKHLSERVVNTYPNAE